MEEKIMALPKGFKHSEETKQKMSKTRTGKKFSVVHRKELSRALFEYYKYHPLIKAGVNNPNYANKGSLAFNWKGGKTTFWRRQAQNVWEKYWCECISMGHDIHHLDGNIRNNQVTNLTVLPHGSHTRLHHLKK